MPIYIDKIPYFITQNKKIALPRNGENCKTGYGCLIFPFTKTLTQTISIINNTENCYGDGKYYYYYYNLLYKGRLNRRPYNIRDTKTRKSTYDYIKQNTRLNPHPPTLLNATPNRNCYFEMSKYYEIYSYMTEKLPPLRKIELFWTYFRSIWESEQTSNYPTKIILINADDYTRFTTNLRESINNPLFIIYYTFYKYLNLIKDLNIDILIYCKRSILRINPSLADEKTYIKIKREMNKVFSKMTDFSKLDETTIDTEIQKETLKSQLSERYNLTGKTEEKDVVTSLKKTTEKKTTIDKHKEVVDTIIDTKVNKAVDKATNEVKTITGKDAMASTSGKEFVQTKSEMELDDDKELIDNMYKFMQTQKVPTKPLSSARDKQMRDKQLSLKLDNLSFKDLDKVNAGKRLIPEKDVSGSIKTINKNMSTVKFANMNKDYIENVMPSDIANAFTALNNKEMKLYVKSIEVKDSSNELNYLDNYRVVLEDENKKRHTISVDIPKFLDNKFMYLGGNKKIIDRQNFLYPIVKTGPDTVQIVSNYNKLFVRRVGSKSISSVERLSKLVADNNASELFLPSLPGSSNGDFATTIEYDEISKVFREYKSGIYYIMFNQKVATDYANNHNIEIPEGYMFIGLIGSAPIFINLDTQVMDENNYTIIDLIVAGLPDELKNQFSKIRSTKKLMYSTVTIMLQTIPFMILLVYWEGISSVLKKMNLKYYFSQRYPSELNNNENVIRFKDCYMVYEENISIGLLMNGLKMIHTEDYNLEEFNTVEPFVAFLKNKYGRVSIMNALSNYYEFMLDPITKEILADINLPTELIEVCLYANSLLADENFTFENSQTLSRIRSIEIIPAILYKELSNAYLDYKNSGGKKSMTIQRDAVIKKVLALQTVENYDTLNPVVELEKDRTLTAKGYNGINKDRAYTEAKRSYDDTMIGTVAMSTSSDANCGIMRFLTLEPNITSARGYVEIKNDKKEELNDANLFSPTELLYPLGNTRDDSIRIAMAGKQSKHVVPVKKSSAALISNGSDEIIKYNLSSDFIVTAEENGKVIDYDEKSQVMMVEYKSGKRRAINLSNRIEKNGGGGFYLTNQLITNLKVGDSFKKNDTLAYHKDFFTDDKLNGTRMKVGALEKVAIMSSYNTYNDSAIITEKLAQDCRASLTFCKSVVVGRNATIYNMKKVGDHIGIGDTLISFDTSFEDSDLNKLLASLSDENKQLLNENSVNDIKTKHAGTIVGIKIYSTVDLDGLSESLQKIVSNYYKDIDQKKKFVSKYDNDPKTSSVVKCGMLLNETTGKIEPNIYGVIKGQKVEDSVLIEFYIEHDDIMGVGDKLTYFTALKGVIGEVIPKGYEPYSEFRPDEEVSSLIGPSAILNRQVPSIILTVLGNKVIVELKRKLEEIYNS